MSLSPKEFMAVYAYLTQCEAFVDRSSGLDVDCDTIEKVSNRMHSYIITALTMIEENTAKDDSEVTQRLFKEWVKQQDEKITRAKTYLAETDV